MYTLFAKWYFLQPYAACKSVVGRLHNQLLWLKQVATVKNATCIYTISIYLSMYENRIGKKIFEIPTFINIGTFGWFAFALASHYHFFYKTTSTYVNIEQWITISLYYRFLVGVTICVLAGFILFKKKSVLYSRGLKLGMHK